MWRFIEMICLALCCFCLFSSICCILNLNFLFCFALFCFVHLSMMCVIAYLLTLLDYAVLWPMGRRCLKMTWRQTCRCWSSQTRPTNVSSQEKTRFGSSSTFAPWRPARSVRFAVTVEKQIWLRNLRQLLPILSVLYLFANCRSIIKAIKLDLWNCVRLSVYLPSSNLRSSPKWPKLCRVRH